MTSASAMINNILVQLHDYVPQERFEEVKMVLYINLKEKEQWEECMEHVPSAQTGSRVKDIGGTTSAQAAPPKWTEYIR